jgi:hypothetical protein
MRLLVSSFCVSIGLAAAATASAQPSNTAPSSYGDRQAGHFGDPGAGYFGNPADGNFGTQSLDAARARAAAANGKADTTAPKRSGAPSPYVVLDPSQSPARTTVKPAAEDAKN